jgi:hypothetical protein
MCEVQILGNAQKCLRGNFSAKNMFFVKILNFVQSFVECKVSLADSTFLIVNLIVASILFRSATVNASASSCGSKSGHEMLGMTCSDADRQQQRYPTNEQHLAASGQRQQQQISCFTVAVLVSSAPSGVVMMTTGSSPPPAQQTCTPAASTASAGCEGDQRPAAGASASSSTPSTTTDDDEKAPPSFYLTGDDSETNGVPSSEAIMRAAQGDEGQHMSQQR